MFHRAHGINVRQMRDSHVPNFALGSGRRQTAVEALRFADLGAPSYPELQFGPASAIDGARPCRSGRSRSDDVQSLDPALSAWN